MSTGYYEWRTPGPARRPPVRGVRRLTATEYASLSDDAKQRRIAHWKGIIRGLQIEHQRTYHSHAAELAAAIRCEVSSCDALALSGSGLCAQHLHKARGAA